ncbi:MAG: peptide ABC transporter substrate-binding protein [Candidatus Moraniibacteriota bacterium]
MFVIFLVALIVGSFFWWMISIYNFVTVAQPSSGGKYVEAFVGQPRYINPLLSHSSSSDKSLSELIFDGLFDYDENGVLIGQIAERFEKSDDLREYTIFLKDNVFWHDGVKVTSDDVLFTANIVSNIEYGAAGVSNEMRLLWSDVQVEKIDDRTIKFKLKEGDSDFLHNLTMGLLPKHVWEDISPDKFQLSEYNQKPIGSGPYEFVDFDIDVDNETITAYILRSNKEYYIKEPFITKFVANFYPTRAEAVEAYIDGSVSAVVVDNQEHVSRLETLAQNKEMELPHYFAVFLNQTKSVPLAFDEVREALSMATNRDQIVQTIFEDHANTRHSPFAEGVVGFDEENQQEKFNIEAANKLLDDKGWKMGDDGFRVKGDDKLKFVLHVGNNHEQIKKVAQELKNQWKEIGVDVSVQEHEKGDLNSNIIKPRDYDALLYAHQMRFEPSLNPLWHGDEKSDPGMNYALFDDDEMNTTLNDFRMIKDENDKNESYKKQQIRLKEENPAIFLFSPKLSFMHSEVVKGMNTQRVNASYDRYSDIINWFVKEKRVRK